jgi:predicted ester cyclase
MTRERVAETYARMMAAISMGDEPTLDELLDENVVDHYPIPGQPAGRDGIKYWMAYVRTAFPDLVGEVEDVIVEGDSVAARVTWRGTHGGVFLGVPATGVAVAFRAFHIVRFRAGRAVEWWGAADLLGALTQMGARVTPPA